MDSDTVVETLRSRGLVAEDSRFGGRGRPGFPVTTPVFLRYFGLSSLSSLPPRNRFAGKVKTVVIHRGSNTDNQADRRLLEAHCVIA